jgi:diguanylate cyclase (GGDEF)-like protein
MNQDGYRWKAVSRVHPEQLAALGVATARRYSIIAGGLMGLLAVVSWLLALSLDDRARARELLERMATTDGLTGVANRRYFMERLSQYWSGFQRHPPLPVGVVMMDLDHFKRINDTHGHAAGDMVLQQFGRLLRASLRDTDTAGRIGGEEFCVLLRGSDPEGVRAYAERIRRQLEADPMTLGGARLATTVTCGGSIFLSSDAIPAAAMQRADAALYRAKAAGRNRVELG